MLYSRSMTTEMKVAAPERRSGARCGRPSGRQLVWALAFGLTLVAGLMVLRWVPLPLAVQYLIAAVPVIAGGMYMNALVCDLRRQRDELQLRIYLEAAVVVVGGLFLMMCTYPLLQAAHLLGPLDWGNVLLFMSVIGAVAYIRALRRYR
jgi:hypothetical protein